MFAILLARRNAAIADRAFPAIAHVVASSTWGSSGMAVIMLTAAILQMQLGPDHLVAIQCSVPT